MSGHSKWASIKHKKGAADAKRGKIFTKLITEITVAARMGGGDEDGNPRLRTAAIKARAANMPKDNIERAIKKGTGDLEGVNYTELTYEAYGPGGVAILINTLTDNKNRTAADVRSILTKGGGSLGETGCVSYLFQRKGVISLDGEGISFDELFEIALDAGAEDVTNDGGFIEVITAPDDFEAVLSALQEKNYSHSMAEITMVPDATMNLDEDGTRKALRLIERLDDLDDVQSVSSNIDIPDDFDPDAE
ncbi:MAG: YebC/PmpR family DNA-binding transcriptional regulator [Spirochaetales bacterium]|jgi:YebC/PmpR family DNA-binding regulatory protein|nr:YebC/PmpR family DNA-binding transcriptional regulator [Spirochaetales bacterium]